MKPESVGMNGWSFQGMAAACREKSMAELTRVRAERLAKHDGELIIAVSYYIKIDFKKIY